MELGLIAKYAKVIGGIVLACVIAGLIAVAFGRTYEHGYKVAQAIGEKNLADYKASVGQASAKAAGDAFARYADGVGRGQAAAFGFLATRAVDNSNATALKEQIDGVSKPHVSPVSQQRSGKGAPSPGDAPAYRCEFSAGFVRLWNAAAGIPDDSAGALQGRPGPGNAAHASPADATADSGVSPADLLDWFVDYANRARGIERQLISVGGLQTAQQ